MALRNIPPVGVADSPLSEGAKMGEELTPPSQSESVADCGRDAPTARPPYGRFVETSLPG